MSHIVQSLQRRDGGQCMDASGAEREREEYSIKPIQHKDAKNQVETVQIGGPMHQPKDGFLNVELLTNFQIKSCIRNLSIQ